MSEMITNVLTILKVSSTFIKMNPKENSVSKFSKKKQKKPKHFIAKKVYTLN